jgi:hypothetical protein
LPSLGVIHRCDAALDHVHELLASTQRVEIGRVPLGRLRVTHAGDRGVYGASTRPRLVGFTRCRATLTRRRDSVLMSACVSGPPDILKQG